MEIPNIIQDVFGQSQIPLTLSDPNRPDEPIVLANDAFFRLTGYASSEIIGLNCRLLQGVSEQPDMRKTLRNDLQHHSDTRALFRNYRRNGEPFDNFLFIFHIFDKLGKLAYRVGSQFEVPLISKASALEMHVNEVRESLKELSAERHSSRGLMIAAAESYGVSVRDLLTARLDMVRSHRVRSKPNGF